MSALEELLISLDLRQYLSLFAENEVDLRTLQVLTDEDLRQLGLPFGPRKRLLNAVAELKQRESQPSAGERRQLTVFFCDMVGFTELAGRLDPEVLQEIIRGYEDICADCVVRYDGYVFQRLGDGIVAFFGYPAAHEDEAERAIRAGLDVIDTLSKREFPEAGFLRVRIGIATGVVVISTGDKGAVGQTAALASRLQGIAEPGSICVSERVRRLAGGVFDYADMGQQHLKGISQPTRAYRVTGLGTAASRFEAATNRGLTPFVGRDREMSSLMNLWKMAREGKGKAAVLCGEAGIGKSRIVSTLRDRLEQEGARPIHFQCSPYYVDSAFYPCIDSLERATRFDRNEPASSKLAKLVSLMVDRFKRPDADVRFIASILSIPCPDANPAAPMTPQRFKDEIIRSLVELMESIARIEPSFMLVEDVHWSDPTTLEVLDRLIQRLQETPLLVLITHRPEFPQRWMGNPYVAQVNLSRLNRDESAAIVGKIAGGKKFPEDLLQQIVDKTDGVPLFIEELTKSILESGEMRDDGDRYTYAGGTARVTIPETLRDSLMARLDRAGTVKEIAQIGAVIGREFSYELISAVAGMSSADLDGRLALLTESGLAYRTGNNSQTVYVFKHALVQDVAYESLLKSRRQQLHGRIAQVLEERFPATRDTEPELLARHYTAAGLDAAAIPFWKEAGELAYRRFALPEAITHLGKGLDLIGRQPRSSERDLAELEIRSLLGPAWVAHAGWARQEVGSVLKPAWRLAESLEHNQIYLPILNGLWVHDLSLCRLTASLDWAQKLLAVGAAMKDGDLEIVGHRAAAASYFWMGQLQSARKHGDIIWATYDPVKHWHIAALTNTDPLTGDGIYRGQYLWMLGYPDQAIAACNAKDDNARRRNHPFDLAFALTLGAQLFGYLGEASQLLERTEEAERVAREHRLPLMSEVMAKISRGIAWLHAGRPRDSVALLRESSDRLMKTGHRIWIWYLRAKLAEAMAKDGDISGALDVIGESVVRIESGEDRVHFAEVLRLQAWILMKAGATDRAEPILRQAIDVARGQHAKSWELRATTTLADLLANRGEPEAARRILVHVYEWFTEGFATKDLQAARAMIGRLG
jgi:class 3 adenylate cyclase/tetratricopeptide (TPR) repeat protein